MTTFYKKYQPRDMPQTRPCPTIDRTQIEIRGLALSFAAYITLHHVTQLQTCIQQSEHSRLNFQRRAKRISVSKSAQDFALDEV